MPADEQITAQEHDESTAAQPGDPYALAKAAAFAQVEQLPDSPYQTALSELISEMLARTA